MSKKIKVKSIAELWKEYCKLAYGNKLANISAVQLYESEKVFYFAIGIFMIEARDNIGALGEDEGAEAFENLLK